MRLHRLLWSDPSPDAGGSSAFGKLRPKVLLRPSELHFGVPEPGHRGGIMALARAPKGYANRAGCQSLPRSHRSDTRRTSSDAGTEPCTSPMARRFTASCPSGTLRQDRRAGLQAILLKPQNGRPRARTPPTATLQFPCARRPDGLARGDHRHRARACAPDLHTGHPIGRIRRTGIKAYEQRRVDRTGSKLGR